MMAAVVLLVLVVLVLLVLVLVLLVLLVLVLLVLLVLVLLVMVVPLRRLRHKGDQLVQLAHRRLAPVDSQQARVRLQLAREHLAGPNARNVDGRVMSGAQGTGARRSARCAPPAGRAGAPAHLDEGRLAAA
jgi:hypothetical protein